MFFHFNEKSQSPDSRLAQFRILRPPVLCSSSFFFPFPPSAIRCRGPTNRRMGRGRGRAPQGPKKGEQNKKRGNKTRGAGQNAPKARGDQRKAGEKEREGNHRRRASKKKEKEEFANSTGGSPENTLDVWRHLGSFFFFLLLRHSPRTLLFPLCSLFLVLLLLRPY